jgi:hypothetical protein
MLEATKKGSKMLVESIDHINATSIVLEEKWTKIQNRLIHKQIEYFKIKDEATNHMQMAMGMDMIQAFNNLAQLMI